MKRGTCRIVRGSIVRVVPGLPEASYLYDKLASDMQACGLRMPVGSALSDAQLACVAGWIESIDGMD